MVDSSLFFNLLTLQMLFLLDSVKLISWWFISGVCVCSVAPVVCSMAKGLYRCMACWEITGPY